MLTRQGWARPRRRRRRAGRGPRSSASSSCTSSAPRSSSCSLAAVALRARGAASACGCAARCRPPGSTPATPPASRSRATNLGNRRTPVLAPARSGRRHPRRPAPPRARCATPSGPGPPTGCPPSAAASSPSARSTVEVSDPFGLARHRRPARARARADRLPPRRRHRARRRGGGDRDPLGSAVPPPHALGRQGDDFYALREYVVGDDLRRVHWPSTARHDELMVRQDEMPWQDRTTVVLDVRRGLAHRGVARAGGVGRGQRRHRRLPRPAPPPAAGQRRRRLRPRQRHRPRRGDHGVPGHASTPSATAASARCSTRLPREPQARRRSSPCSAGPRRAELDTLARLRRSFGTVVVVVTEGRRCPSRRPLQARLTRVDARPRRRLRRRRGAAWSGRSARRSWRERAAVSRLAAAWATAPSDAQARRRDRLRRARRSPPPFGFCRLFVGWSFLAAAGCWPPSPPTCWPSSAAARWTSAWRCRRSPRSPGWPWSPASPSTAAPAPSACPRRDTLERHERPTSASAWHDVRHRHRPGRRRAPASSWPPRSSASGCRRFLADSFAFRAGAALEAILPPGILFVFARALGADRLRLLSHGPVARRAPPLAFVLHRTHGPGGRRGWLAGHPARHRRRGRCASAPSSALGAIVLGAGRRARCCPGAGDEALARHPQPRLGHPPDGQPAGRHPGPHRRPQRHRGCSRSGRRRRATGGSPPSTSSTAGIWSSSADLRRRRRRARRRPARAATRTPLDAGRSRSRASTSIWLPGGVRAGADRHRRATSATTPRRPASSPSRATTSSRARSTGRVARSRTSTPDDARRRPPAPPPGSIATHYLELPANFPADLRQLASDITANGTTPYEKALALQNYFRKNFTYDLSVQPGPRHQRHRGLPRASARATASSSPAPSPPSPASLGMPARVGGRLHAGRRCGPDGALPRARQARPRLARGVLHRHRLGALRADAEPRRPRRRELHRRARSSRTARRRSRPATTVAPAPRRRPAVSIARSHPTATSAPTCRSRTSAARRRPRSSQAGGRPWLVRAGIVAAGRCSCWPCSGSWSSPRAHPRRAGTGGAGRPRPGPTRCWCRWHEADRRRWPAPASPPRPSETPLEFADRARRRPRDRRRRPRAAHGRRRHRGRLRRRRRRPTRSSATPTTSATASSSTLHGPGRAAAPSCAWRADPRPLLQPLPGDHERRRRPRARRSAGAGRRVERRRWRRSLERSRRRRDAA